MSNRAGYSDDLDQKDLAMWRGRVMSAIRGKRGQKLLRDLRDALDAMPEKRLISGKLRTPDGCCALGCVAEKRGVDINALLKITGPEDDEPDDGDNEIISDALDIAEPLVREIEYQNDYYCNTDEQRWTYMRKWVEDHIKK